MNPTERKRVGRFGGGGKYSAPYKEPFPQLKPTPWSWSAARAPSLEMPKHRLECKYQDIVQVFLYHILYGPDDLDDHKSKIL